jgi:hypothetical protein
LERVQDANEKESRGGGRGIEFFHNRKIRDDSLMMWSGYDIKTGMDGHRPELMMERMRVLLSSGIYWLWEKWDRIRFPVKLGDFVINPKTFIDESEVEFKVLSFSDSDIHLVFYLWGVGCGLACIAWTCELAFIFTWPLLQKAGRSAVTLIVELTRMLVAFVLGICMDLLSKMNSV